MAEWKKIVVSGSDISQLNNDSGYLTSGGTIDSASVAARATTLSPDATASFADLASDARTADSASVAARATELSADATASYALVAGDARNADSASVAARATTLSPEATASHALYAVTASHALNVPDTASHALTAVSASIADELSQLATASFALVAGDARNADSASVAARATTLSADATASFADLASDARTATSASIASTADSASVAARATTLSADATASYALLSGNTRNADSSSVAARATTLSPLATASFADFATTASQADSATLANTATNVANGIAISASAIDVTGDITVAGTASFGYLQTITGSAVIIDNEYVVVNAQLPGARFAGIQVYDSGSTSSTSSLAWDSQNNKWIYTNASGSTYSGGGLISGPRNTGAPGSETYPTNNTIVRGQGGDHIYDSNITDDDSNITLGIDTIVSGDLDVNGEVSASSFVGDGSGLTGLSAETADSASVAARATTLSADATASFSLVAGTSRNADSASVAARATTLSTDATASFADLASTARSADSASVAARATTLSADATASIADRATSASIADELSQLATASFALTAGNALNAENAVNATLAVSSSATFAGHLFPTTQGLAGQGLALNDGLEFVYGDFFGTGSTKKLNQTEAASTWSFQHSLNESYPIVQAWDSSGDMLIPERIETIDLNNVKLYFAEATTGVASAMVGGMGISASNATRATSASIADEASTLSPTATASIADFATTASHALTGDGIFSGSFSGSFEGDGSNLTGVASTLAVSSSNDLTGDSINLKTEVLSFAGATNEVSISIDPGNNTVNVGLAHNVTVPNNLTVTGDLTVSGTTTTINTQNLFVEDRFILLNSGSTNPDEGGIVIDEGNGFGHAYVYDSDSNRFGFTGSLDATSDSVTPDAFVASVVDEAAGHSDVAEYQKPGNIRVASNGDIFIYS
jgi:hypothetical protein